MRPGWRLGWMASFITGTWAMRCSFSTTGHRYRRRRRRRAERRGDSFTCGAAGGHVTCGTGVLPGASRSELESIVPLTSYFLFKGLLFAVAMLQF